MSEGRPAGCISRRPSGTPGDTAHFGYLTIPAREKARWVRRHFNVVAPRYDVLNTFLSFGLHHSWKRTAVRMLNLHPGNRVLDVCGGTADLALLAVRDVGLSGRVVLYDINRNMISVGRSKARRRGVGAQLEYIQGDAENISFPNESFDAAMVGFGIRNLTCLEQGLREMHRVLRPGGKMMCLEFSMPMAPVFRWLYDIYSFYVMPWGGKLFTGSKEAYTYLPESIRVFPPPDRLSEILRAVGFKSVRYRALTNGIAFVHTGIRDARA
jgi:demethylmenaquinone methyltransferase/2-methoxy-6-polyprenyl-1,4-benzoquinol methylase